MVRREMMAGGETVVQGYALKPARAVGNKAGRKATGIHVERGMPRMVHPWRMRKTVFAHDLGEKMQRFTCIAPFRIGNGRPSVLHGA